MGQRLMGKGLSVVGTDQVELQGFEKPRSEVI
jgi:hypothetical protein